MASAGGVLGRCCGSGLGSAGAPSSQGLWGRPRSTGASGCRRRMRGPRCWGRARASVPAPWRARGVDDQETALGHAAGRAGMPCPRWGLRQSSGAPLSSLRSSATPKARMRQVRSHNVTDDSGSPEGCSQPSSPPLCGGVMTGCSLGTSRVPMGHHRTCACAAPPVCRCVGTPQSRARPIRMRRRGNRPWQPGGAYGWRTICRADGLCCVCGRSKTAAVRSVRRAARR